MVLSGVMIVVKFLCFFSWLVDCACCFNVGISDEFIGGGCAAGECASLCVLLHARVIVCRTV